MTQQGWITQTASVVLIAERPINPDTLSVDILRESGVTPQHWEATPTEEGSPRTFIAYTNGVSISAQNTRCVFQQTFNDETVADDVHQIYEAAKRYVDATRLVQYRFVGINWTLHLAAPDPKEWVQVHLLNPDKPLDRYRNIELKLTAPFDSSVCNLTFAARSEHVALASNYHFNMRNIAPHEAIDKWLQCDQNRRCVLTEDFGHSS